MYFIIRDRNKIDVGNMLDNVRCGAAVTLVLRIEQ